jgi:hypothetical protein
MKTINFPNCEGFSDFAREPDFLQLNHVSQAVNEGLELLKETQTVGCDTGARKIAHN